MNQSEFIFNGSDYNEEHDKQRLTTQIKRLYCVMRDGKYRTLDEIEAITHDPVTSISAQLRNFRKKEFGLNIVNKRHRGNVKSGLWEYQLIPNGNPEEFLH